MIDSVIIKSMLSPALLGFSVFDPAAVMAVANIWSQVLDVVNGAVITPSTADQKEAKESLENAARPFRLNTAQFKASLLEEADVELNEFLSACDAFQFIVANMGTWTGPLAREGYKNSAMVRSRLNADAAEASMRALLTDEVAARIHRPNGVVADPSGATGILWAHRGLTLWVAMLRRCADPSSWGDKPPVHLMKASFDYAYEQEIKQFHGSIMQGGVALGTSWMPKWEDVHPKFAPTLDEVHHDIRQWVEVMDALLPRIDAMIKEFDMHDIRKTF